jgi:hypothetical protein
MAKSSARPSSHRLVTGNDADGKSRFVDGRDILEGANGNFDHWKIQTAGVRPERQPFDQILPFFPNGGQVFFCQFWVRPTEPETPPAVLDEIAHEMFEHFGSALVHGSKIHQFEPMRRRPKPA